LFATFGSDGLNGESPKREEGGPGFLPFPWPFLFVWLCSSLSHPHPLFYQPRRGLWEERGVLFFHSIYDCCGEKGGAGSLGGEGVPDNLLRLPLSPGGGQLEPLLTLTLFFPYVFLFYSQSCSRRFSPPYPFFWRPSSTLVSTGSSFTGLLPFFWKTSNRRASVGGGPSFPVFVAAVSSRKVLFGPNQGFLSFSKVRLLFSFPPQSAGTPRWKSFHHKIPLLGGTVFGESTEF